MRGILAATLPLLLCLATEAGAHGGSYPPPPPPRFGGPNGGVPPGQREPSDPDPPPPPDSGGPDSPSTPDDSPPPPPETPPDNGHETPGADTPPGGAPGPATGSGQGRPATTTKRDYYESWRWWWRYNNDDILNVKSHIYGKTSSASPVFFASKRDAENRRDPLRPTRRAVSVSVVPALLATINRVDEDDDVRGGAVIALGKLGNWKHIPIFESAIWDRYETPRGQLIRVGTQTSESAALALGLLPDIGDLSRVLSRSICIQAIDDDKLRTRERAWAAISLGLRRDRQAVDMIATRIVKDYADDNIPAALLCAIGLIGDCEETQAVRPQLEDAFRTGVLFGKDLGANQRLRAYVGYALCKIGDPRSLPVMLSTLGSRRQGRVVKCSAAIATGALAAAESNDRKREDAAQALARYIRSSGGDASGENFAIISMSRIGTERALSTLMEIAESGTYTQRPFAALALGTRVFYCDRDAKTGGARSMDAALRRRIVEHLAKLSGERMDTETRAAFLLARGLVRDTTATEEMVRIASSPSADPIVRGYACIALGLLGEASNEAKEALRIALAERKSAALRRDAATALGLLHDADVVGLLLAELKQARSLAVQGQIIMAIGTIGDHTAIKPLVEILEDRSENPTTRAMAVVGLGMVGDLLDIRALARVAQDYNYRASVPELDELLAIL